MIKQIVIIWKIEAFSLSLSLLLIYDSYNLTIRVTLKNP